LIVDQAAIKPAKALMLLENELRARAMLSGHITANSSCIQWPRERALTPPERGFV
jgi:hypothetical protein